MSIDADIILAEIVRYEVVSAETGDVIRWGDCARRDFAMQARDETEIVQAPAE